MNIVLILLYYFWKSTKIIYIIYIILIILTSYGGTSANGWIIKPNGSIEELSKSSDDGMLYDVNLMKRGLQLPINNSNLFHS